MQQSSAKLGGTHKMLFAPETSGLVPDGDQHGLAYIIAYIYIYI